MKKFVSVLLVLCMAVGLALPAFGEAVLDEAPLGAAADASFAPLPEETQPPAVNTPKAANTVTDETALRQAMAAGGEYVLGASIDLQEAAHLSIEKEKPVTLDLQGFSLKAASGQYLFQIQQDASLAVQDSAGGGQLVGNGNTVVQVKGGTFTLENGIITGGNSNNRGGGVELYDSSGGWYNTFIMKNGAIRGNQAVGQGGGVYAGMRSTFTMSGGVIENCSAMQGGGVSVTGMFDGNGSGVFAVTGSARVQNCTASMANYGGGVYLNGGKLQVGGDAFIWDNTARDKMCNVMLRMALQSSGDVIQVTEDLTEKAKIGLTFNLQSVPAGDWTLIADDAGGPEQDLDNLHRFFLDADPVQWLISGTANGKQPQTEQMPATAIALEPEGTTLEKGSKTTLQVRAMPEGAKLPAITGWASSNTAMVRVDEDGSVHAVGNGTAVVTVQAENGMTASSTITVQTRDQAVALDRTALTLEPGETAKVKATVSPSDATYKYIFWTSSDETVATVSDSGLVTAVAEGTATITAKSWYGHEAVCTVTVKTTDEPTPPEPVDPWPTEGLAGFVTRCYRVALSRDPDQAGHVDWVRWLQDGTVDATACTYGFVFSKEMNNKNLSNEDFVKTLYRLFMDREGEATGVAFWTDYLKAGHSREEVFYGFADSVEFGRIKANYGIA